MKPVDGGKPVKITDIEEVWFKFRNGYIDQGEGYVKIFDHGKKNPDVEDLKIVHDGIEYNIDFDNRLDYMDITLYDLIIAQKEMDANVLILN